MSFILKDPVSPATQSFATRRHCKRCAEVTDQRFRDRRFSMAQMKNPRSEVVPTMVICVSYSYDTCLRCGFVDCLYENQLLADVKTEDGYSFI